ncbi:MAG: organic solvent tolerance protein OstA [Chlorobi bacterium]|nr:organic solvent tolerance protein OstA [Chlorobiota bacterium]
MTFLRYFKYLFLLVFLAHGISVFAQETTRVKLIRADEWKHDKRLGEKIQRLIGDVILKHDSTYLYCDSAYLNDETNSFEGFGNVRVMVSDTLNIYSEWLNYNGNTRIAELDKNVRLVDKKATLFTEHLWYDRNTKIAWYLTGGKIVDTANQLTSQRGYFFTDRNEAYFSESVKLVNEKYTMDSDSMMYNTTFKVSHFFAPTTIVSDSNLIYCERGWYDTENDKSFFRINSYIITREQKLEADSLYYERTTDFGVARGNVVMTDTINNMMLLGNYGEFKKRAGYSFVTDSALAIMVDERDSLFLHSDTLWMLFDSDQNIKSILAYHHAKFFRNDLQGLCDSLVYGFADSTIYLYKSPVMWSEANQLTADSVRIALANNQIDSLALISSAFIISIDDSLDQTYNQVKGRTLVGYFKNNEMVKIMINGNAESIYFVRDEDKNLMGINKSVSSDMNIYLENNEISILTPIINVDAHMYPVGELSGPELKLKHFKWIEGRRPVKKEDVFVW